MIYCFMESASSAPSACWDILSLNVHFPTDYLSYCYCMTVNLIIFIYVYLLLRFYVRIFNVSNCHCNSLSGLKGFQGLINQSINPSINQSISQSINQLTNQSLSLPPSLSPSLSPPPPSRYLLVDPCEPVPVWFSEPVLVPPHLVSAFDEQL